MKPASLHDRIRQDIESRIMSGAWEAGHRIPPEHALMADYDCSRMTVNKAISALVERGLIERRKRAGSFVAAPTVHRAAIDIPDIAAEIEGQGRSHGLVMLDQADREAEAADRALLAMAGGRVLALTCLHRADGAPFALEERLINLAMVPAARTIDFTRESPGRWLLGHVPWTDARHRITAIAATPVIAGNLDLEAGAPCLSIERWTWRTAERITYVRQIYPGSHALTARFIA
ncbi:MAG TPA: histidine utilization repressor [Sphingobium sp.]|jgi:GntR family histidine utilization transcriptional repressor|uniref:histidine utilization repressor n=1 Tax=unclassified Sphingobium TaxID=2611147 RepID=UPI0007F45B67|nr:MULTISPECIES: histidine utilization repressor [unclassified Sphingobium]OAN56677.1 histidine utilization repressor [Sphingobium sp. TCM1]WIW90710.1 histidine utilization repressor [Sphingobium sp. V4]HAF43271.1 histidine utilization repressor [Sphingobium sp.]